MDYITYIMQDELDENVEWFPEEAKVFTIAQSWTC